MDTHCPHCGLWLEQISDDGHTRTLAMLVEIRGVYDGGLFFQCPWCAGRWHRFPKGHYLRARAHKYVMGMADEIGGSDDSN